MEDFRILDPDPYNNSTGSASLVSTIGTCKLVRLRHVFHRKLFFHPNLVTVTPQKKQCYGFKCTVPVLNLDPDPKICLNLDPDHTGELPV